MITVYYEFDGYPGTKTFDSYAELTEWLEWKFRSADIFYASFSITKIEA